MRYLTAGESHGEALYGIIEGLPSGLKINCQYINELLRLRQDVYGRGSRSRTVKDEAFIKSGLNAGGTTGAPLTVIIPNGNAGAKGDFDFYRPGHVDYAADLKYCYGDAALGAERASARETAMRTALGGVVTAMLNELGISIKAHVINIGGVKAACELTEMDEALRCDKSSAQRIKAAIDEAELSGDTLGGQIKLTISGVKCGIGSHVAYDRRLDYRLCGALMSIPAVKAVELGLGSQFAAKSGKAVADALQNENEQIVAMGNNGGGIDGGISNGQDVVFTLTVKPIPSIEGLPTVNTKGSNVVTGKVRGDVTAVPAACIVAEAVAALELGSAIIDCLGGDTMDELIARYKLKGEACKILK